MDEYLIIKIDRYDCRGLIDGYYWAIVKKDKDGNYNEERYQRYRNKETAIEQLEKIRAKTRR